MELPKVVERPTVGESIITLILGNYNPAVRKDWHCDRCGRIVFNYYSEVRVVIVGEMREVSRPVDIMCSRCKKIFRVI